jgi:DNA primase
MVRQANDIVSVIGEYIPLKRRGRLYVGLCPFHDDHHPSLTVDPSRQIFRCWACGKGGDVFAFVQERERVGFREALEFLARRANVPLRRGQTPSEARQRLQLYDLMKWAEECFQRYLLEAEDARPARLYLAERGLNPQTIQTYGIGYAPDCWTWLVREASHAGWTEELLIVAGLAGRRESDGSCFDRFRDRVMFPIRDVRGRTVGFGGRILPSSPNAGTSPKYYNSADTPLFTKSEHLYGLDRARLAGEREGYLAVVEGYTDVLMAHQMGVLQVVATLGTALNVRHILQLKRYVPRVVLVFDADAGGERGVDRALELFVSQDVDLAIATLPPGLDPCDLLLRDGPEAFRQVLGSAVDALEFKLRQEMSPENLSSVNGTAEALDRVLGVLAAAPDMPGQAGALRRDLVLTRVAQRARVDLRQVWRRYRELVRAKRLANNSNKAAPSASTVRPKPAEVQLLQILLAEPEFVGRAVAGVGLDDISHPGLRTLLAELYALHAQGVFPTIDQLRLRLEDRPRLAQAATRLHLAGLELPDRRIALEQLLEVFQKRRERQVAYRLQGQLQSLPNDAPVPVELLRKLQELGRT